MAPRVDEDAMDPIVHALAEQHGVLLVLDEVEAQEEVIAGADADDVVAGSQVDDRTVLLSRLPLNTDAELRTRPSTSSSSSSSSNRLRRRRRRRRQRRRGGGVGE